MTWICDGIPKNGQTYPDALGEHPPEKNSGSHCVCGLPEESGRSDNTTISTEETPTRSIPWVPIIIALAVGTLLTGAFFAFKFFKSGDPNSIVTPTPSPTASPGSTASPSPTSSPTALPNSTGLVSDGATNAALISQGEKILLDPNPNKIAAADQFAAKNWDGAIAAYEQAIANNSNDPESKIYLQNAKAQKQGNPLTIAVAIPSKTNPNSAKEILRGVAQAQSYFNASASQLIQVVIFGYGDDEKNTGTQGKPIAEDINKASQVLAVLGYGLDTASNQALSVYEQSNLAALSPLTVNVQQSTLKIIPLKEKASQLSANYLQSVALTIAQYANKQHPTPSAVIFHNSDSSIYSSQLKSKLTDALSSVQGKVIKEIDVSHGGFDAATEVSNAQNQGANTLILALSKNQLDAAIQIAQANNKLGSPLVILGSDELFNPDILIKGGDAIANLILAVPWSFQPGDLFAQEALDSWKGRVSWRTVTAFEATNILIQALKNNPTRSSVLQFLQQGALVPKSNNLSSLQAFKNVPLVIATKGKEGPPGSQYQFDPIKNP